MPDILSCAQSHLFGINRFYWSHSVEEVRSGNFLATTSHFVWRSDRGRTEVVRGLSRKLTTLETRGVKSSGRDQRGEMIKIKAGDKRGERNDGGRLESLRGISKSS